MPSALIQFNSAGIYLKEVEKFPDLDEYNETIDKDQFLEEIKSCRWYGPYLMERTTGLFVFFAWNQAANNIYHARLQIYFELKSIDFSIRKGRFQIVPSYCFS